MMTHQLLAYWQLFAAVAGGLLAVCLLVVLLLAVCSRRRSCKTTRRNNEPPSISSSSSSSRLLSNQHAVEKQEDEKEYKQDAWFAAMSTPAAYRYMNDPKSKEKIRIPAEATCTRIHLIILVHGWNGRPCSLGYMKDALERQAAAAASAAATDKNDDRPCFIIHAATANQDQTCDGVAAGGCRLAQEVDEIIQNIEKQWKQRHDHHHSAPTTSGSSSSSSSKKQQLLSISLSIVGHSLGGLYARYALSKISSLQKTRDFSNKDDDIHGDMLVDAATHVVEPAIFCTTCSPHLGLQDELLYIPNLPRWFQYMLACILQQTGQDLFRFTSLLEEMVLQPTFRNALALFQQRITYVNTYATDFQVSTQTAAFLAPDDNLWHRQVVSSSTTAAAATNNMISLVVETCQRPSQQQQQQQREGNAIITSHQGSSPSLSTKTRPMATNAQLAAEMDALGWTKVFCDVRDEIQCFPRFCTSCSASNSISNAAAATPTMTTPLRSMSAMSSNSSSSTNDSSTSIHDTVDLKDQNSKLTSSLGRGDDDKSRENDDRQLDNDNDSAAENVHYYTSNELLQRFNNVDSSKQQQDRWYVPSAHLVMVASTKREFLVERTAAGRPIMDELASRVIQGILQMREVPK